MFAPAAEFLELHHFVQLVIAVGVADPVQTTPRTIDHHVQAVERPEHSLGVRDLDGQVLDLGRLLAPQRGDGDPAQALAFLVAHQQPPLRIAGQADPRAEFVLGHGEEPFDLEPGRHVEALVAATGATGVGEHVAPRVVAQGGDAGGGLPLFRVGPRSSLPLGRRDHVPRLGLVGGQHDLADEGGRAPFIRDAGDQRIFARDQLSRDVDFDRLLPLLAAGDHLAIEFNDRLVVARGLEPRPLRPPGEPGAKSVVAILVAAPDPLRFGALAELIAGSPLGARGLLTGDPGQGGNLGNLLKETISDLVGGPSRGQPRS